MSFVPRSWIRSIASFKLKTERTGRRAKRSTVHPLLECLEDRTTPATFSNINSEIALRTAIDTANSNGEASNIFVLTSNITLATVNTAGQENLNQTGDLDLYNSNGSIAAKSYIFEGGGFQITQTVNDRVLQVLAGTNSNGVASVQFQNVTLAGGTAVDNGTAGAAANTTAAIGGGILNLDPVNNTGANLSFTGVTISGNKAQGGNGAAGAGGAAGGSGLDARGGGLYSENGTISVSASTFTNNRAQAGNGGVGGNGAGNVATGGAGGTGGNGGSASGGGIWVGAGRLTLDSNSVVTTNSAQSGSGGLGGAGGTGFTIGGASGNGGNGGSVAGAGIASQSAAIIIQGGSAVRGNDATALAGGTGGRGGDITGAVGRGAAGGNGGSGGSAQGAGVSVLAGSLILDKADVSNNNATAGAGGVGGKGGGGTFGGGTTGGRGGNGGNAGAVRGVGIYVGAGNVSITASTISSNKPGTAAAGGAGGAGGTVSTNAGAGGTGGSGGSVEGLGLYLGGGTVSISSSTIALNGGSTAGNGGVGGAGGSGSHPGAGGSGGAGGNYQGAGVFFNAGDLTLLNSTVSSNNVGAAGNGGIGGAGATAGSNGTAGSSRGGGIYVATGTVNFNSTTIANNNAAISGGGIVNAAGNVSLYNSIVADNSAPTSGSDFFGQFFSLYSLMEDPSGSTLLPGSQNTITLADPLLGALANNGGPTLTHLPAINSPAVDAGDPSAVVSAYDQRGVGFPRALGRLDMGAVEAAGAPTINSVSNVTFSPGSFGTFSVTTIGNPIATLTRSGTLPSGINFVDNGNGTATLSGNTTVIGNFPLTFSASNGFSPDASQNFTLTIDSPPIVSRVDRQNPATSPTSNNNVTFRVTFNQNVTGVDSGDFSVNAGTLGAVTSINATTYDVPVNSIGLFNGTLTLSLAGAPSIQNSLGTALVNTTLTGMNNTYVHLVNQVPVNQTPSNATVVAGGSVQFSKANGNAISVTDVDAGTGNISVNLNVTCGTLAVAINWGATFTGQNTGNLTLTGTLDQVQKALDTVFYQAYSTTGSATAPGAVTLTMRSNDNGNTGAGGPLTDTDSFTIQVQSASSHANVAPVANVPAGNQTITPTVPFALNDAAGNAISVGDIDAGYGTVQLTLSVAQGRINLGSTVGLTFVSGTTNNSSTIVVRGRIDHINYNLQNLTYTSFNSFNGLDTMTVKIEDLGATGSGGNLSNTKTVKLVGTPLPVNQPPVNTVPGAQVAVAGKSLLFTAANGNAITIADPDAGARNVSVNLKVNVGTLAIAIAYGNVTYTGYGTNNLTLTGSIDNINKSLGTLFYQAGAAIGPDTLTITTNDLENFGVGGAKTDVDTVAINVQALASHVNSTPTITAPLATQNVTRNTSFPLTSIALGDLDAGYDSVQVTLAVSHGTLGLTPLVGGPTLTGNGTATITLVGRIDHINYMLQSLLYTPATGYTGGDSLAITINDHGRNGTGGAKQANQNVAIQVN